MKRWSNRITRIELIRRAMVVLARCSDSLAVHDRGGGQVDSADLGDPRPGLRLEKEPPSPARSPPRNRGAEREYPFRLNQVEGRERSTGWGLSEVVLLGTQVASFGELFPLPGGYSPRIEAVESLRPPIGLRSSLPPSRSSVSRLFFFPFDLCLLAFCFLPLPHRPTAFL